ncbi:MAG: O-antigen ligase family protein [Candidatus Moranbacteria bacterium]|nr:O-antigen ligase family protein [Candidatus Moranbacteria bacterium]
MLYRFLQSINPIKIALICGSVLFSCVLIALNTIGVLPLALGDFVFFSGVIFLCALYRPGWAFLFFIGLLPFEIVSVAPKEIGVLLRPYQWVGTLTLAATMTRFLGGRLPFALPRVHRLDMLLPVLWVGSVIAVLGAPDRGVSLKQSAVLLSFIALYALVRIFIRNASDVKNTVVFFLGSGMIVSLYALWQNIRFAQGMDAFEVMAGRPNSVFAEPDWLGVFLAICISAVYAMLFAYRKPRVYEGDVLKLLGIASPIALKARHITVGALYALLALLYVALLLSVARSAWLSVALIAIVATFAVLTEGAWLDVSQWKWKRGFVYAVGIFGTFIASLLLVFSLHLTSFRLLDRASSTASGLQRITIACQGDIALPQSIASADELAAYGCRHIDLEEKESAASAGEVVKEIDRDDPNVSIRKSIYAKTFSLIREHFFTGIGFGSVATFLGNDERGTGLNTSNIFLEVWLGSGLLGLMALLIIWLSIGIVSFRRFALLRARPDVAAVYLFLFLSWLGLSIFNLFNAGIFLGFFWAWLSVAVSFVHKRL